MKYTPLTSRYDETEVLYRRCGKSGVLLPKVSLGLWHNFGADCNKENARSIIRHAFDKGIVHFDLANNYGPPNGSAEDTFGHIYKEDLQPYRNELFIATKAGYPMWEGVYGNWGSRKHLFASIDESLSRLNLEYVDLFYSHRYDPNTPLEETLQALVDIVKQGKALYIGISRWPLEALEKAYNYLNARDIPILAYQERLNLLDRKPQDNHILSFCEAHGIGFLSFSPLAQGLLTDKYLDGIPQNSRMAKGTSLTKETLTPELLGYLQKLNRHAQDRGETLSQMALSWILSQKGVTSVIVGASSIKQLDTNLQCIYSPVVDIDLL